MIINLTTDKQIYFVMCTVYLNIPKHVCDLTVNDVDPNSTNDEIISDDVLNFLHRY